MKFLIPLALLFIAALAWSEPPLDLNLNANTVINWRKTVATLHHQKNLHVLPRPQVTPRQTLYLSLREAIFLALRNNPSILNDELTRVTDKFNLVVARYAFEPQYSLPLSAVYSNTDTPSYSVNPTVQLTTPIGTVINAGYTDSFTNNGPVASISVEQPLLKGSSLAVNLAPWWNALDNEIIARLNFKNGIITTVVNVITSYRQLVQDYQQIAVQQHTLTEQAEQLKHSKLRLRLGQLAKSDYIEQQAQYASTKLTLIQQQSAVYSNYQTLLTNLGLVSTAKISVDQKINFSHLKKPNLPYCIKIALQNNTAYQTALIQLRETRRAVTTAKDANRWSLSATGTLAFASNTNNSLINVQGIGLLFPTSNTTRSFALNLSIPINDVPSKQALLSARIALEQAENSLQEIKDALVRNVTQQVQTIENQFMQVKQSEKAIQLKQAAYEAARIKFNYGKTTAFEVSQLQDQLLSLQQDWVAQEINLLNSYTILNQTLGITLDKWKIALRY